MNCTRRAKSVRLLQPLVLGTLVLTLTAAAIPASAETPTDIYNFKGGTGDVSGALPYGLIAQGRDGNFYGEAPAGGANGDGGIFMVTPSGTETLLYSFKSSDCTGCQPGLNLANDGNFYGHCLYGGSGSNGRLFKVTPTRTFSHLHVFPGGLCGATPNSPPLQRL